MLRLVRKVSESLRQVLIRRVGKERCPSCVDYQVAILTAIEYIRDRGDPDKAAEVLESALGLGPETGGGSDG